MDYDDEERNWDLYSVAGSILITDGYVFSLLIGLPTYHFTYNCTISQNWMKNWIHSLGVCVLGFLYRDETDSSAYCKNVRNCSCNAWMVEIETVEIVAPFKKVQLFWLFSKKGRILKVEELELKNYENIWINNRLWETQFWFVLIFSLIFVIFALKPLY